MARLTVKTESKKETAPAPAEKVASPAPAAAAWHPLEDLRREIDRLFEDFGRGSWFRPARPSAFNLEPIFRRQFSWNVPAADMVEKEKAYEITAELPGLDQNDIEVAVKNGNIVIKGEKQEEKEEKAKDYYVRERQFGSFQRAFAIPQGVDASKIDAAFRNGILTVTLPKTVEAQKPEKKIRVKAA